MGFGKKYGLGNGIGICFFFLGYFNKFEMSDGKWF